MRRPPMDEFLADQSEYASVARRCIRRDLVHLRLLEKNEKWMRPALKARIRSNLKELELCNVLIDWTLERPDDAGSFIIKV